MGYLRGHLGYLGGKLGCHPGNLCFKPANIGHLHASKKSNVLLTWVYTFWNGYQTDRNWTLNQDQEKNFGIFAGKKFAARKTAKNGIYGHFWGIFGTFAWKILKLESWNFASTFVLIEWIYTREKRIRFISTRYPKWPKLQNFEQHLVTSAYMGELFLKRMAPNFLEWLSRT